MLSTSTAGSSVDEDSDSTFSELSSMSATGLNDTPLPLDEHLLPEVYLRQQTHRQSCSGTPHCFEQDGAIIRTKASNSRRLILVCCEAGDEQQGCAYRVYLEQVNRGQ